MAILDVLSGGLGFSGPQSGPAVSGAGGGSGASGGGIVINAPLAAANPNARRVGGNDGLSPTVMVGIAIAAAAFFFAFGKR